MRLLLILGIILAFAAAGGKAQNGPAQGNRFSVAFEAVWKDVQENFYDPSFLGVDWNEVGERYRARLAQVDSDDRFVLLIREMLRQLPTSHLGFRPREAATKTGIGALTRNIDGKEVVADVWHASDAMRQNLHDGDVILSSPQDVTGLWGTSAHLQIETCDGKQKTLDVRREAYGWPFERPSLRWQIVRPSPTVKIGYMRIQHFEDDFAPVADQAMEELKDTSALVIDLRNNSGGNASYIRLLSYLTPPHMAFALLSRPFLNQFGRAPEKMDEAMISRLPKVTGAYTTERIIDAFRKNGGGAAFYTEDVGSSGYHGKIAVLVNQETASAAEGFAANLKGEPKVTIIGQPTAGAVAGAEPFSIPGGWTLVLPTHAAWLPDGTIYRDEKTVPDVMVPLTRQDLCDGRDVALNRAFNLLLPSQ